MRKIFSLLIILFLSVSSVFADSITKTKLPTGQTVIVKEIHTNPIVMIDTWVKTGSINENDSNNGVAHFLEHLFFKGSLNYPNNEFDKILEAKGASTNAATSKDFTHFHILIPSDDFETAIKLHADMLSRPLLPSLEIDKERNVVIREIERSNDNPSRILNNIFYKTLYPNHPYKREVLGTKDIISNISRDEIFDFYYQNYSPENLITVIVGDVNPKDAITLVNKNFNNTYASKNPKQYSFKNDKKPKIQISVNSKQDVNTSSLLIGYKCGLKVSDKDSYAIDILATVLGQGKSSRLYKDIKDEKQLAQSISASHVSMKEDSIFVIGASLHEDDIDSVKKAVFEQIENIKNNLISSEEINRAKHMLEQSTLYSRESVSGNASEIGYSTLLTGNWNFYNEYLDNMNKVSAKDIKNVAKKYLNAKHAVIASVTPEVKQPKNTKKISSKNNSQKSMLSSKKYFSPNYHKPLNSEFINNLKKYTLDNDATLIIDNHKNNEIISVDIKIKGGNYINPNPALPAITASVMEEGTNSYPKEFFAEISEEKGIYINASSDKEYFHLTMKCIKSDLPLALDMLHEVINNAAISNEGVEKTKQSALYAIKQNRDNPVNVAFEELSHLLWKNTPYDTTGINVEKYIPKISHQDVLNYYKNLFDSKNTIIAINGDVDNQQMINYFSETFKIKNGNKINYADYKDKFQIISKNETTIKNQGKESAWLVYAWQTDGLINKKDYVTLKVINAILGSGMSSRLFSEVRAQKGLAYAIGSTSNALMNKGSFCIYIGTDPKKVSQAEKALLFELKRFQNEFVSDKELDDAKSKLKGETILKMETNSAKAHYLSLSELNGFGMNYYFDNFNKDIDSVTLSDVITVANKYFSKPYVFSKVIPKK